MVRDPVRGVGVLRYEGFGGWERLSFCCLWFDGGEKGRGRSEVRNGVSENPMKILFRPQYTMLLF